ncbi:MAG: 30S ribosomal protein S27e [Candidatus Bathyarchaeota archaeon]|nr:30S ribosomal protein S27e [Candidatus Bathyarchaeota archaeon]
MARYEELIPKPRGRFLRVKCPSCGNEQVIFEKPTVRVMCRICDQVLAEPRGDKGKILAEILEYLT